jgi:hypothetical protein
MWRLWLYGTSKWTGKRLMFWRPRSAALEKSGNEGYDLRLEWIAKIRLVRALCLASVPGRL